MLKQKPHDWNYRNSRREDVIMCLMLSLTIIINIRDRVIYANKQECQ